MNEALIHKDVKPANVLVDMASGGVWLTASALRPACLVSTEILMRRRLSPARYLTWLRSRPAG